MTTSQIPGLMPWLREAAATLDLPENVILPTPLLDLASQVAHEVLRPGAPTSTFLVGVALGRELERMDQQEKNDDDLLASRLQELIQRLTCLAASHRAEPTPSASREATDSTPETSTSSA